MRTFTVSLLSSTGIFFSALPIFTTPALPLINTNNIINVTSYGAVGDNATDNTTAIQSAINTAAAGGTARIPAGIFCAGRWP